MPPVACSRLEARKLTSVSASFPYKERRNHSGFLSSSSYPTASKSPGTRHGTKTRIQHSRTCRTTPRDHPAVYSTRGTIKRGWARRKARPRTDACGRPTCKVVWAPVGAWPQRALEPCREPLRPTGALASSVQNWDPLSFLGDWAHFCIAVVTSLTTAPSPSSQAGLAPRD